MIVSKKSIEEILVKRHVKEPATWFYMILRPIVAVLNKKAHTEFIYKARPAENPNPIILISNHASRNDYMFTSPVVFPKKLNYVVGYNEFFRFPLGLFLRAVQAIPKKNFTPDLHCMKQIINIVKKGGNICIMPEGMSSITGMAQPVIAGSAKLIKKLGIDVYYTKVSGGYLTYTKHCLDERVGKIQVVVDQMFTADELKNLSIEEIEDRMNRLLAHDDYIWNKEAQISFNGKGNLAKNLETLLYRCPKCDSLYKHITSGNSMKCTCCGNEIEIDDKYNIRAVGDDSICPDIVTDWTIMEREKAKEMVMQPDFTYSEKVKIGVLPKEKMLTGQDTSLICGEGTLMLDSSGLSFDGTKDGEPYSFHLTTDEVPTFGMCTDISRFYTFVKGKFIEFYPENNDVLLWDHLVEEMHRVQGGIWQNTEYRHTV